MFPLEIAMLETDRQLAANGITTAYHGITVSWEPGLRSLEQALKIIAALDRLEPQFLVDHRIHIRWETFALDEMAEVQALFARSKKPLLAFNDHTTPDAHGRARRQQGAAAPPSGRWSMLQSYMKLLRAVGARAGCSAGGDPRHGRCGRGARRCRCCPMTTRRRRCAPASGRSARGSPSSR